MRRRVLREDDGFPPQIRHRLDAVAHDDAVAAVRPVDLLIDTRHDAGVFAKPLEEQRQHVERRPADMEVARGIRVAHGDRIVDQDQFDLEILPARRLPDSARLEAVVRVDDRTPSRPDVDRESHRAVDHRFVAGYPLDFRQPRRRDVFVLFDRRDPGAVGRFGSALDLLQLFVGDASGLTAAGAERAVSPHREADQAEDDEQNGDVERRFGLSVRHGEVLP